MTEDPKFPSQSAWERYQQRKAAAQKEGFTGRFWSSRDYQPKGTKPVWYNRSVENPNIVYWKPDELARYRADLPHAKYDETKEQQSYWDDPKAVGHWYDFLSVQDDDYVPPDWMDVDSIKSLYKELKNFNDSEDWRSWKPLPFGSMANYQAQMMPYPYGVNPNTPTSTRTQTLYTKRMPTVFANIQDAIEQFNKVQSDIQTKGNMEDADYQAMAKAIQQYNVPLEEIEAIDPELYRELGGKIDPTKMFTPVSADQTPFGQLDWNKFPGWMRFMMTLTTAAAYPNRPLGNIKTAAAIPAGIQAYMVKSLSSMVFGAIATKLSAPLAKVVPSKYLKIAVPLISFAVGTAVGIDQYNRAMRGDTSVSATDKIFKFMGWLDEQAERLQGFQSIVTQDMTGKSENELYQMQPDGMAFKDWMQKVRADAEQTVADRPENFGKPGYFQAAWKAAQLYYDAGGINIGDWMTDSVSKAFFLVQQMYPEESRPFLSEGFTTQAGQVWRLNEGIDTPQNTEYWGAKTLNNVTQEIMALGKDATKDEIAIILAKWQDRYGYSGSMNNLAGQILISPTNLIPLLGDIGIEKIADAKLKTATKANDFPAMVKWTQVKNAAKWAQGNPLTDLLPMGVQQGFEALMKIPGAESKWYEWWQGSKSPLEVYANFKAHEASGYAYDAYEKIAEVATAAKIVDLTGNEIKGKIIDSTDVSYKIQDAEGRIYELTSADAVTKITDAEGKDIAVPEGMKGVVDKALYESALEVVKNKVYQDNAENLAKALTDDPGVVGGKLGKVINKLVSLTPAAQLEQTARSLNEVILNMNNFAGSNGDTFNDLIRFYGGDLDIPKIITAAKEFGLGGLISETAMAWKSFVTSPEGRAKMAQFDMMKPHRAEVNNLAKMIGADSRKMVEGMKPSDIYSALKKANPALAAQTDELKIADLIKPFAKGAAVNDTEYISKMTFDIMEATEKFLIEKYGITAIPVAERFSNLLKAALGTVVITENIPAHITNFMTNEITTAIMIGSSAWMTKSQQKKFFDRIGIAANVLTGEGFGLNAEVTGGLHGVWKTLNPPDSWMTKTQQWIKSASEKIPFLGKNYARIENFSRGRALAGAIQDAMRLPISDIPPDRLATLHKYMSDIEINALSSLAQKSYNGQELLDAFADGVEFHRFVEDAIEGSFMKLAGGNEENADILRDVFNKTELGEWMRENMPKLKTPTDLENFRSLFYEKWNDAIDMMHANSMINKVQEIKTSPEGVIGALKAYNELEIFKLDTMMDVNKKWDATYDRMADVPDKAMKDQIFAYQVDWQNRTWQRTWGYIENVTAELMQKMGVGEYSDRFVNLLDAEAKRTRSYFDTVRDIRQTYYDMPATKANDALRDAELKAESKAWRDFQADTNRKQADLWIEMLGKNVKTVNGLEGDALVAAAQKFWDAYLGGKQAMRDAIDKHYASLEGLPISARQQKGYEFFTKDYRAMTTALRNKFIQENYDRFFKVDPNPKPAKPKKGKAETRTPDQIAHDTVVENTKATKNKNEASVEAKVLQTQAVNRANGIEARKQVLEGLKFSNATQEQLDLYTIVLDAGAKTWGQVTGRDYSEWYGEYFSRFDKLDADSIRQGAGAASFDLDADGRAILQFTKRSNFTSASHEVSHTYLKMIADYYTKGLSNDLDIVAKELGGIEGKELARLMDGYRTKTLTDAEFKQLEAISEKFVDGATEWYTKQTAGTLKGVFDRFGAFLRSLFEAVGKVFDIKLSENMQKVYNKLFEMNYEEGVRSRTAEPTPPAEPIEPSGQLRLFEQSLKEVTKLNFLDGQDKVADVVRGLEELDIKPDSPEWEQYKDVWLKAQELSKPLSEHEINVKAMKLMQSAGEVPDDYPVFYSQLYRNLETKGLPNRLTVDAAKNIVNGAGTKAEVEWLGVIPWLDSKGEFVTKEELLGYIDMNKIVLADHFRGVPYKYQFSEIDYLPSLTYSSEDRWIIPLGTHDSYTTELVWKEDAPDEATAVKMAIEQANANPNSVRRAFPDKNIPVSYDMVTVAGGDNYRELTIILDTDKALFSSGHWNKETNIAGWTRFDDRLSPSGAKMLNLLEIQSDWAQQGAKYGFHWDVPKEPVLEDMGGGIWEVRNRFWDRGKYGNKVVAENLITIQEVSQGKYSITTPDTLKEVRTLFDSPQEAFEASTLPSILLQKSTTLKYGADQMPFKDFHLLVLKRMLRYAVDNGYDELTFPTGSLAAEIEGHQIVTDISKISWKEGSKELLYQKPGYDEDIWDISKMADGNMEDYIGADAAKSLREAPVDAQGYHVLDTKDIVFGGEKFRWFYDQVVVNDFNKYLKQWGIKIEDGKIQLNSQRVGERYRYLKDKPLTPQEAYDKFGKEDIALVYSNGDNINRIEMVEPYRSRESLMRISGSSNVDYVLETAWNQFNDRLNRKLNVSLFIGDFDDGKIEVVTRPVHKITFNDRMKQVVAQGQRILQPITEVPVGGEVQGRQDWQGWNEVVNHSLDPLFNTVMDGFKDYMGEPAMKLKYDAVGEDGKQALKAQYARWNADIQLRTSTAVNYGKVMTDHALLNYTEKRGIDGILQSVFPFQFWYTHSIGEWAKHMIAKPSIGATYSKYKELLRRNGLKGLPSRLAGKSPLYAPWLPDELGDTLWINPMAKAFPLDSLTQPIANLADLSYDISTAAIYKINEMQRAGYISKEQALEAIETRSGTIWNNAVSTARIENGDTLDPMSMVSLTMQPAPWYTIPYYALTGQKDKITTFPPTRQGLALAAQDPDGIIGAIGKLMAYPEVKMREIAELSPWGNFDNYYIEWMLANITATGKYDSDVVVRAMLEKKGQAYDDAKQLADEYLSYRMPGSALMQAVKNGEVEYIAPAFLATMFPAGLFPKGEMIQRGLADEFGKAWDAFLLGDNTALVDFFDANPEYEARLALFKEPEERLRSHLINIVWDSYMKLSDPDKKLVNDQFGRSFQTYFLNTDTRDYEQLDVDKLAYWARQMNATVPETESTESALNRTLEPLEMYKPDVAAAGQTFIDLRKQQFPNYWWLGNLFMEIPEKDRDAFLKGFPEYKDYLDWKEDYVKANPLAKIYLDDQKERYDDSDATQWEEPNTDLFAEWDAELALAVGMYLATGQPLNDGAKAELTRIWTGLGRPGGNFDLWLRAYLGM